MPLCRIAASTTRLMDGKFLNGELERVTSLDCARESSTGIQNSVKILTNNSPCAVLPKSTLLHSFPGAARGRKCFKCVSNNSRYGCTFVVVDRCIESGVDGH